MVLELVTGGELFDFIINRGHLDEQEAQQITKQLMEALRFLHCDPDPNPNQDLVLGPS